MRFEIIFAPQAVEDLDRLRAADRSAVKDGIETHLRHAPTKLGKSRIKRLRGTRSPEYRLRIEEHRVFYDVVEGRVEVMAIVAKPQAEVWLKGHATWL